LAEARPVTVQANHMPLEVFLNTVLKEEGLKFSFQGKTIVISRRPPDPAPAVLPAEASPDPPSDLHGRVTDSAGNPLAGASVAVKGTNLVFSTNDRGDFILKGVKAPAGLVVSYIGFEPKEVTLNGKETYTIGSCSGTTTTRWMK